VRTGAVAAHARSQNLGEVDDRFYRFALTEEQPPWSVTACPVSEQLFRDRRCAFVFCLPPALYVLAQGVDQRQIVTFLFADKRQLQQVGYGQARTRYG